MTKHNTLLVGDCLIHLANIETGSVDLVYLDPPFFSQTVWRSKTRDNTQEYSFNDKWESLQEYKAFLAERVQECKRVLKNTGSIFLQCDRTASHHLRLMLDELFGSENFQSEIIWNYRRWSNSKSGLLNTHQTIYFYSKSAVYKFNRIFTDYSPTTNIDQILQERERNEYGKVVYKRDTTGEVVQGKEKKGVPLSDVWDIPYLNPKANERTGYPTQKPILLLERLITIASDEEDLILDPFCGSGTSLVAAQLLNRRWLGIDVSNDAINLAQSRLNIPKRTSSRLLELGEAAYLNQNDKTRSILNSLDAIIVERNAGIDGFLKTHYLETPVAIKIQRASESLEEAQKKLLRACATKGCILKILIRTNPRRDLTLFESEFEDNNLIVLDSYDLIVGEWLNNPRLKATPPSDIAN